MSAQSELMEAVRKYVSSAGVPLTEFNEYFTARMIEAMMVSYHKYGGVADAYPRKFNALSDIRARLNKYRETGNKHYLVDAANFCMIEAMHPAREDAVWGGNSAADSPGRTSVDDRKLIQEDNAGNRIIGETILHLPDEPD